MISVLLSGRMVGFTLSTFLVLRSSKGLMIKSRYFFVFMAPFMVVKLGYTGIQIKNSLLNDARSIIYMNNSAFKKRHSWGIEGMVSRP